MITQCHKIYQYANFSKSTNNKGKIPEKYDQIRIYTQSNRTATSITQKCRARERVTYFDGWESSKGIPL